MHLFLLCLYLMMVIARPHELYPEYSFPPLLIILVVTFVAWFLSEKNQKILTQHYYLVMFFIVLMMTLVAEGWIGGVVNVFNEMLPVILVFFIITGTINNIQRLQILLKVILISTVFVCIHSIDQSINGIGWSGAPMINGRIAYYGIFSDPNDFGLLLVFLLPVSIYFYNISDKFFKRMFFLTITLVLLYTVYLTNSRGAMLAVGLMLMFMLYRRKGMAVTGFMMALLIPLVLLIPSRLSEIDTEEESASNRFEAWYDGIQMFISEPFLGVGYKMFTEHHYMTAHNSYVLVLAETGIIGFFFWLGIIVLTFIEARYALNTVTNQPLTVAEAGVSDLNKLMLALFLGLMAVLFGIFWLSRTYNILIYLVLSILISATSIAYDSGVVPYKFRQKHMLVLVYTFMAVPALYLITKVLL